MLIHKKIDIICCIAVVFALLVTALFLNAEALGIQAADKVMGYEERLFDETKVHTIDIIIDDWDAFLSTCQSEEYSVCNVLIDGEAYTNVGIRGKGNTSLSTVSSMNSNRYSFKVEFDQYDNTKSYYGLDKLCLNNIIQDNTYMKDFLAYQMMEEFGADAPLCSYVYITVNGEEWGLYLAVEAIEDGFLQRNYGSDYGELYKPDSMSFGGGRGNGKDFDMGDMFGGGMPDMGNKESGRDRESSRDFGGLGGGFGGFGMGSSDVKLQYIDDNASSYSNIFGSAKTDISDADEQRLIASLKALTEGEDIESVVDIDEVLRYFVVHNFLVNGDSYTGSMIHNYYLYEEDGQMSMIPWDYNLAYGTFQGSNATGTVNDPIDSPVSGSTSDRPMIHWIFANEEYTELYHEYFTEFIEKYYTNGELLELVNYTAELIAPYVEKDPTKFCTYEDFETGVEAMRKFCELRLESVAGQLAGTIPSTSAGQSADSSNLVDASGLNISDLGTMNMGGGAPGGFGGDRGNRGDRNEGNMFGGEMPNMGNMPQGGFPGGNMQMPGGTEMPDGVSGASRENSQQTPQDGSQGDSGETGKGSTDKTRPSISGMQMPDMGNMQFPGFNGTGSTGNIGASGGSTIGLLIASLVCLLAGLLVAYKYKR